MRQSFAPAQSNALIIVGLRARIDGLNPHVAIGMSDKTLRKSVSPPHCSRRIFCGLLLNAESGCLGRR
jgi:hypothetical protein